MDKLCITLYMYKLCVNFGQPDDISYPALWFKV